VHLLGGQLPLFLMSGKGKGDAQNCKGVLARKDRDEERAQIPANGAETPAAKAFFQYKQYSMMTKEMDKNQ
jgi:hypothetical protein